METFLSTDLMKKHCYNRLDEILASFQDFIPLVLPRK